MTTKKRTKSGTTSGKAAKPPSIAEAAEAEAAQFATELRERIADDDGNKGRAVLANGIVFQCRPVPRQIMRELLARMPEPEPPEVYLEEKKRSEPNPDDPDYLREHAEWTVKLGDASTNAMLLLGTELVSVPEGMDRPEGTRWLERLRLMGINSVGDSEDARYLLWLKCYAAAEEAAMQLLTTTVIRSGITLREEDVDGLVRAFRNRKTRGADTERPAEEGGADGDQAPDDNTGDRPGD